MSQSQARYAFAAFMLLAGACTRDGKPPAVSPEPPPEQNVTEVEPDAGAWQPPEQQLDAGETPPEQGPSDAGKQTPPEPTDSDAGAQTPPEPSVSDAGSDAGADAGTTSGVNSCTALTLERPGVAEEIVRGTPPTLSDAPLISGTYDLVKRVMFIHSNDAAQIRICEQVVAQEAAATGNMSMAVRITTLETGGYQFELLLQERRGRGELVGTLDAQLSSTGPNCTRLLHADGREEYTPNLPPEPQRVRSGLSMNGSVLTSITTEAGGEFCTRVDTLERRGS
jgi:hypothetical protein